MNIQLHFPNTKLSKNSLPCLSLCDNNGVELDKMKEKKKDQELY